MIQIGSNVKNYEVGDVVIPKLPGFGTWRTHAVVDITQDSDLTPFIKVNDLTIDQAATFLLIHQLHTNCCINSSKIGNQVIGLFKMLGILKPVNI